MATQPGIFGFPKNQWRGIIPFPNPNLHSARWIPRGDQPHISDLDSQNLGQKGAVLGLSFHVQVLWNNYPGSSLSSPARGASGHPTGAPGSFSHQHFEIKVAEKDGEIFLYVKAGIPWFLLHPYGIFGSNSFPDISLGIFFLHPEIPSCIISIILPKYCSPHGQ